MDKMLAELNPEISRTGDFEFTPDGDAEVDASENFQIPVCQNCRGVLKPDVVFFGESVPTNTVELAMKRLDEADVLLVAGTSLTVNSGLRFARRAARANKPIIIVNIGATKADELATAKIEANTSLVLERLLID
jgi:NAD-dependent SIR2 family protein deacetylase